MTPSVIISGLILVWFAHYTRAATIFSHVCKTKSLDESHRHVASPAIEEAYKGSSFPLPKLHLNINSQEKGEGSSYFTLSEEVQLSIISDVDGQPVSKLLTAAIDRWCERRALFPPPPQNSVKHHAENIKNIVLSIAPSIPTIDAGSCAAHVPSSSVRLCQDSGNHTTDKEAYHIEMKKGTGTITVHIAGIHGGINGLSALLQLLFVPLKAAETVSIMDWPSKRWRGLMLDVSRHFIPPRLIYKTIDAMELSRLNILHLHLTDSQSFPIQLEDVVLANGSTLALSALAQQGAFSNDKVYKLQELRDIVAYATIRGIEVIPEIDMPAHALSWGKSFTDVIVPCHILANSQQTPHNIYPLDPSNPTTFLLVEEILKQIIGIFPSRYLHIGGDEVNEQCWRESVALQEWAQRTNVNAHHLTKYFETEVFRIVLHKLKKIPIVWQGILDAGNIPEESVFTAEGAQPTTKTTVRSRGRRLTSVASAMATDEPLLLFPSESSSSSSEDTAKVIIEPWKCWGGLAVRAASEAIGRRQYPVWMAACHYLDYNSDWTTFLMTDQLGKVDPASLPKPYSSSASSASSAASPSASSAPNGRRQHSDYFLGGEGAMWTEYVDHTNFECRVWPRAGAIAQSLWGFHPDVDGPTATTTAASYSSSTADSATLTPAFTQYLYASYVHFRYFLTHVLHVAAAPLIFHYPERSGGNHGASTSSSTLSTQDALSSPSSSHSHSHSHSSASSGPQNLVPIYPKNMSRALQLIDALEAGITITSSGPKVIASLPAGAIHKTGHQMWMSSQCLGIPESIQRPLTTSTISVVQLNIADGSLGPRRDQMLAWLQSKAQAGVMVVGFCELVGWNTLHSKTELVKNLPWLALRAAHAGFVHSYVSKPYATNAYPVGLVSIYPMEVLHEWHAPQLQRGAVHVYIEALQLHVVVVHLHAHDATLRAQEAAWLMHMLQPILARGERLVLMGDLNTLSPYDRRHHEAQGLLRLLERADHPVFSRLRKKFTTPDGQHMDYRAMQHFLNAGLRDSCVEMCCQQAAHAVSTRDVPKKKPTTGGGGEVAARARARRASTTASKSAYETCRVPLTWPLTALHGGSGSGGSGGGGGGGGGGGHRKEEPAAHESKAFDAAALRAAYDAAGMPSWSLATAASLEANSTTATADTAFVTCMRQYCARSEPTQFNPEWPAHVGVEHPQIRLDYIFMNDAALGRTKPPQEKQGGGKDDNDDDGDGHMVAAGIEATNVTTMLSDHFPAYASWRDPRQFPHGVDLFGH